MSNYHTDLLKISRGKFNKCFTELSDKEKEEVITTYYDYY